MFGVLLLTLCFSNLINFADDNIELSQAEQTILKQMRENQWERLRQIRNSSPNPSILAPENLSLDTLLSVNDSPFGTTIKRYVPVNSTETLKSAIATALPGDFIHLESGIYTGQFDIMASGIDTAPIILHGTRDAIIESDFSDTDYGINLLADYWILSGFSVRHVAKGIVTDNAHHNIIQGVKVYNIGDEGIHLRSNSTHNLVKQNWIHDTGQNQPEFGEAIYIGSAESNWELYSDGQPDKSDANDIISNLIGPNITAEGIDIKEGTSGGRVINNTFIGTNTFVVDSWIDVKGNDYVIRENIGSYVSDSTIVHPVKVVNILPGWGMNNNIHQNSFISVDTAEFQAPYLAMDNITSSLNLVVPGRKLPYTLSELIIRHPDIFEHIGADSHLLNSHLVLVNGVRLTIKPYDLHNLKMSVSDTQFSSFVSYRSHVFIQGFVDQQIAFQSWDAEEQQPVLDIRQGRPFVYAFGGYMEVHYAGFYDLGFEEGTVSGVAWKGAQVGDTIEYSRGASYNSVYERNYFGAYTFEAIKMVWKWNTFRNNISYGFDPHDFSNDFIVEENAAYGNGNHGIIFSRGCDRNIIRNNISYDNDGHGIMIDDGKVIVTSPVPRYVAPVASNDNIIEGNHVWNNLDGIVVEGGARNIVRDNIIDGVHRYGIRLKDDVIETQIHDNTIKGAERYGVFVYNGSHRNHIVTNYIQGTQSGIGLQAVQGNIIRNNEMYILGAAVRLKGDVSYTSIEDNIIKGNGSMPIDDRESRNMTSADFMSINDFTGWRQPPPMLSTVMGYIALAVWLALIMMPFIVRGIMMVTQRWTAIPPIRRLGMNQ